MIRRSPHNRKAGRVVHAVLERKSLERNQSLVVIHRQDSIELRVIAETEESVRRIWSERENAL